MKIGIGGTLTGNDMVLIGGKIDPAHTFFIKSIDPTGQTMTLTTALLPGFTGNAVLDTAHDPVAVVLELVQPGVARRRRQSGDPRNEHEAGASHQQLLALADDARVQLKIHRPECQKLDLRRLGDALHIPKS